MNRFKKIGRSVISSMLIAGLLMTSSAIAPMTMTPAQAVDIGTGPGPGSGSGSGSGSSFGGAFKYLKTGFGVLSSVLGAVGPALVGKILNATGNTELADYFGLNTTMNLKEIQEGITDIQEQLGSISEQVTTLGKQLDSATMQITTWTTLNTFTDTYGRLASKSNDALKKLAQVETNYENGIDPEIYNKLVADNMNAIYDDGDFYDSVIAMGDAIMGKNSSLISPTRAYYQFAMQVDGITRDQLLQQYIDFSNKTYQDYVLAVMLCNGAMAYRTEQGDGMHEIDMQALSEQSQEVLRYLINEREELFPTDRVGTISGNIMQLEYVDIPDAHLTANDYIVTYTNGEPEFKKKTDDKSLQLSERYVTLDVGEASAVKVFNEGKQCFGKWESKDARVAVVDEFGGIFATGVGTAELTVTVGGETMSVQVDVVDVDSYATTVTSTTGPVTDNIIAGSDYDLNDLLEDTEIEDVNAGDYTWHTTDPNGVVIDGNTVKGVALQHGHREPSGAL